MRVRLRRPLSRRRARAHVVLAALVVLTGCSGGDDPSPAANPAVRLDAADFRFEPDRLTVGGPGQVTLVLTNRGDAVHNLTVAEAGVDIDVTPGRSFNVIFVAPAGSQTLELSCKYHRDRGMVGSLRVG